MSDISSFSINMSGSTQELSSIQRFLTQGLHEPEGDPTKDRILDLDAVYQDLDDMVEQTTLWVANEEVFVWSPGDLSLTLTGESKVMPPISLVERLSRQHPGVHFELQGTIEEHEFRRWTVQAGSKTLVDFGFLNDHDPHEIHWLVKDGEKFPNYYEPWGGLRPASACFDVQSQPPSPGGSAEQDDSFAEPETSCA